MPNFGDYPIDIHVEAKTNNINAILLCLSMSMRIGLIILGHILAMASNLSCNWIV